MKKDDRAVTGLPIQLIVYVIVVAIVVPAAWSGGISYSRHRTEDSLEMELRYIATMIKEVYIYRNQSRVIDVDFSSGIGAKIEWVEIGGAEDDPWSRLSTIRYKMEHKGVQTIIISEPNIPVTNIEDGLSGSLQLVDGEQTLYIEGIEDDTFRDGQRAVRISKISNI